MVGGSTRFNSFSYLYNEIYMNVPNSIGIVVQGNVTNTVFTRTNIIGKTNVGKAIFFSPTGDQLNVFQYNQLFSLFSIDNSAIKATGNCVYGNWDQAGNQRSDFTNNTSVPCRAGL